MAESPKKNKPEVPLTSYFIKELTTQIAQAFIQNQNQQIIPTPQIDQTIQPVAVKFDGKNYGIWSNLAEGCLSMKEKFGFVNGERVELTPSDVGYPRWKAENAQVKNWLLNSIEPNLIGNYVHHTSAKDIWNALKITYFDGGDLSHFYSLKKKEYQIKQGGGSVENFYSMLQGLWREIDSRRPNSMVCLVDIEKRNKELQEDRLVIFLGGLDERLDGVRAEIIRTNPPLTVDEAYGRVHREEERQGVMLGDRNGPSHNPMAMVVQDGNFSFNQVSQNRPSYSYTGHPGVLNSVQLGESNSGVSMGHQIFTSKGNTEETQNGKPTNYPPGTGLFTWKNRPGPNKKNMYCTNCGKKNHTKEGCYKLIGFPDWYPEFKKKKAAEAAAAAEKGKSTLAVTGKTEKATEGEGNVYLSQCNYHTRKNNSWIIDSGATDHMIFL
jgi:gag-polypeptide of LTR copia-type